MLGFVFLILLSSFASATTYSHGLTMTNLGANTNCMGNKFTTDFPTDEDYLFDGADIKWKPSSYRFCISFKWN